LIKSRVLKYVIERYLAMAYLAYLQKTIPKDPSGNWTLNNFTNNNIITITAIVEKIVPRIHPVFKRIIRKRLNIKVAKIKPNHLKKKCM